MKVTVLVTEVTSFTHVFVNASLFFPFFYLTIIKFYIFYAIFSVVESSLVDLTVTRVVLLFGYLFCLCFLVFARVLKFYQALTQVF